MSISRATAFAFSTSFSDVELSKDSFVAAPRVFAQKPLYRLIFVGGLSQLYKAPDVLLDAVAECLGNRCRLDLAIAGSGQYQHSLALRAESLGISNRVKFLGQLTTPEAVRQALDEADLFVLPSRQEGLPRAMIEAMARALPCIGSTVGGIPELLPASDLVPPNDPQALSKRIGEVLADPTRMNFMSARNLQKAREFLHTPEQRRQAFYRHVRTETEQWLARKSTS